MPPARSGIADYSAALLSELRTFAEVTVFEQAPESFRPNDFDIALYQIGNNADHLFVYEMALRYPGVVVLHEANLHHLMADLTIRRGNWDGYVRECEFDGGEPARAHAERTRALETGPDYEGVPMLRRISASALGVIAHSQYVLDRVRAAGFAGPSAIIPHGAWVDEPLTPEDRNFTRAGVRDRLGVDESTPLIGAFGYIKPYKRIAETLRALRRVVRLDSRVKMILGGEPHPDFPVAQIIRSLDLDAHVRLLGYTPEQEFAAYINACDIVVNLRSPTVGETSGSLLRAFSVGRPALVSDVGAFAELPGDICLKVPVGAGEEEVIFEYLNLLVARPDLGREIGARARQWASRECSWKAVAHKYCDFLGSVARGEADASPDLDKTLAEANEPPAGIAVTTDYLKTWAVSPAASQYFDLHALRLAHTLEITPPGDESKSVLEMGAYIQITPALKYKLNYGYVRGCYYGSLGRIDHKRVTSQDQVEFECLIDHFDAEKDIYPYENQSFDTVLCCELIEHLLSDPMHMMSEVNRILKPGGYFVLTTPNIASSRAISAILAGYHPSFFSAYIKPNPNGDTDARHNREYAPREIEELLKASGFDVVRLETGPFRDEDYAQYHWVQLLLEKLSYQTTLRGDGIYALARKSGAVRERWPSWLYS